MILEKMKYKKLKLIMKKKIKTNVVNVGQGGPVNTADILEQLRKMKEELQKETGIVQNTEIDIKNNNIEINEDKNSLEETKIENSEELIEDKRIRNSEEELKEQSIQTEVEKNEEIKSDIENNENIENKEEFLEENENVQKDIETLEKNDDKVEEVERQEKIEQLDKKIKRVKYLQYEEEEKADFNEMYVKLFGTRPISTESEENIEEKTKSVAVDWVKNNVSVFETEEKYNKPLYKFIGIVFNTYIIIEIDKEMYIIDQHAAHERIMYEKVKRNYYSESSKDSQMLLLPDIITLSHKEMEIARENIDMFEKAGFSLEEFGENTIKLTGVPTVCIDIDNKELFLETLDEINTVARTAKQEKEEKFIATVACKAAVKAHMVLAKEEVENLMEKLLELPNPFTCPHGRPTAIKMTKYDIERKFARK